MRVTELARATGVTPSLISQIERGQSRPSVATLFSIAEALGVAVDALFDRSAAAQRDSQGLVNHQEGLGSASASTVPSDSDGSGSRYVVRADGREALDIEGGVRWERLTPETLPYAEFLELVYAPGAQSNANPYRHPGTEMVLMLSGQIVIDVGFESFELNAGDSIQFPSSMPHRYCNNTQEAAHAVTVILHDYDTSGSGDDTSG